MTNINKQLAEKFGMAESRAVSRSVTNKDVFEGSQSLEMFGFQMELLPLSRDIEQLMRLAVDNDISIIMLENIKKAVVSNKKRRHSTYAENYADHPTKLDALCEALSRALLGE